MSNSLEIIAGWQIFYATLATACAALIGLLFIAFTFRSDLLNNSKNTIYLDLSRKLFGDFITVLLAAFMFLIPKINSSGLAICLFIIGLERTFFVGKSLLESKRRIKKNTTSGMRVDRGYFLSLFGALGILIVSIFLFFGYMDILYWCVAPMATLLISASSSAWKLLTIQLNK